MTWQNEALCRNTHNRAFIDLSGAHDHARAAAKKICAGCPVVKECAAAALEAGDTLDGVPMPAGDVIAAGVECRGDRATAAALAVIAGLPMPMVATAPTRFKVPERCLACARPLVRWQRGGQAPPGSVMHYARGYCKECRGAYNAYLEKHGRAVIGLRKSTDRGRHSAATGLETVAERDERVRWVLRHRLPGLPAERVCVDCKRSFAEVGHRGRGLCSRCYIKWQDRGLIAELTRADAAALAARAEYLQRRALAERGPRPGRCRGCRRVVHDRRAQADATAAAKYGGRGLCTACYALWATTQPQRALQTPQTPLQPAALDAA